MSTEDKTTIYYQNSIEQLNSLVKAAVPIIWVVTAEENRFLKTFEHEVSAKQNRELWTWSAYRGLIPYEEEYNSDVVAKAKNEFEGSWSPTRALELICSMDTPDKKRGMIFVLKDFHSVLSQPIPRHLRDIYEHLITQHKTLVIVAPCLAHGAGGSKPGLDPTLEKQITVVDYELPNREEIKDRIIKEIAIAKEQKRGEKTKFNLSYTDEEYERFATALQGLTELEIDNALYTCLTHLKCINEKRLLLEKKQVIKRSDILEYIGLTPSFNEVGGCDNLKKYFRLYNKQFSPGAKEFGIDPLRAVLITGTCGCGKSLAVKAVASEWNLPLLRLDIGRVMAGIVGQSEARMRDALSQAAACAPCILQLDEIEKALSGTKSSGQSDGGTLSRVFGTLLTAMEEGMKDIILLATSNDISALPPELIRRFNEVFFVDLPTSVEREEIFKIHLAKKNRKLSSSDFPQLVNATQGFTGSEIEKVVKEGLVHAYHDGKRELQAKDILGAIQSTRPVSQIMGEQITVIREWAKDRARYASSLAEAEAQNTSRINNRSNKKTINDIDKKLNGLDEEISGTKTTLSDTAKSSSVHRKIDL